MNCGSRPPRSPPLALLARPSPSRHQVKHWSGGQVLGCRCIMTLTPSSSCEHGSLRDTVPRWAPLAPSRTRGESILTLVAPAERQVPASKYLASLRTAAAL